MERRWLTHGSRPGDGRSLAALLAVAALAALLSACGSSSSTGTDGSTAEIVKKEAGLFNKDVQLTVIDQLPNTDHFIVCFSTPLNCENLFHGPGETVEPDQPISRLFQQGQSVTRVAERPQGEIYVQLGPPSTYSTHISFESFNPDVGEPWIAIGGSGRSFDASNAGRIHLSEGESHEVETGTSPDAPTVTVKREEDTDHKVITLTVSP
jgi:hypothetical protein